MTNRDKDPFDKLFKKLLRDFFGEDYKKSGFHSVFDEMEEMMNKMNEEDFWKSVEEKRRFSNNQPFTFGFSIRKDPSGETSINTFGDKTEEKEKEPLVDVFESENEISVTAEIPGVSEENIDVSAKKSEVLIEARGESKAYSKNVNLPSDIDPDSMESNYNNGVLSLKFDKK
ncbi:MAG: Molecular chaperone HSP20 family, IbpA [Candidatus Methanohalarchaeum thermophilum]|uniref:Molecular chaperone HSP20 family, IbpA n=1 Tax=Methanohalarchaeum thermophilum TaxID=1903181 RepID=A0A1Q6DUA5_METT1|nr:MAG: Molecular chaperone HSP20 family, IbpA [Candidatus Methanohalarchaeum thermophilum]